MTETKDFWTRLAEAQGEFGKAILDESNPQQGYRYASYASLTEAVRPALSSRGIAIVHDVDEDDMVEMDFFQGYRQWVSVRTILKAADGEYDSGLVRVPVQGRWQRGGESRHEAGVQDYGSALTYAKRYGLEIVLGISREDEDSVDKQPQRATQEQPAREQRQQRQPRQEQQRPRQQEEEYKITPSMVSMWNRKKPEEYLGEFQRLSKSQGQMAAIAYHNWLREEKQYTFDREAGRYVPIEPAEEANDEAAEEGETTEAATEEQTAQEEGP